MLKIDVIGDVMLDIYNFGEVKRVSPEGPHLVFNDTVTKYELGGAGHIVRLLKNFGLEPTLHAAIGFDEAGGTVKSILNEHEIHANLKQQNKTTVKSRFIANGQTVLRVDVDGYCDSEFSVSNTADICLVSDYNKGTISRNLLKQLIGSHKKVYVDVKQSDPSFYAGSYLIKPNQREFDNFIVQGSCEFEKIEYIMDNYQIENIWITRSERGSTLYYRAKSSILREDFEVKRAEVRDVTGAGDVMIASLVYAQAEGFSLIESCKFAHLAAAQAISKIGTTPISCTDIELILSEYLSNQIVFTNGCFDLLHFGHLELLKFCKSLGGKVIVGLNSDASVKRLKGPMRPINNQDFRKQMLMSLNYVDEVILFDEDDPSLLIEQLKPNVLVKGSDYSIDQIAGSKFVLENGGRIELFDLVEGLSSTNIIAQINGK